MAKCDIRPQSNDKIGVGTSKCKIRTEFKSQIGFRMSTIFGPSSKVQKGFRLSKCDIQPQFECQNRISNVKMR